MRRACPSAAYAPQKSNNKTNPKKHPFPPKKKHPNKSTKIQNKTGKKKPNVAYIVCSPCRRPVGLTSVVKVEVLRTAADVEVVGVRGVYRHAADVFTAGPFEDRHPRLASEGGAEVERQNHAVLACPTQHNTRGETTVRGVIGRTLRQR